MEENEYREFLENKIARCREIIDGLSNYRPFLLAIEDFQETIKYVDGSWHTLGPNQQDKFFELKAQKMAAQSVMDIVGTYKHDLEKATEQLAQLLHPEEVQTGYVDNE